MNSPCPYCTLEWQDWTWAESSFDGTWAYRREISKCPVCGRLNERIVNEVKV